MNRLPLLFAILLFVGPLFAPGMADTKYYHLEDSWQNHPGWEAREEVAAGRLTFDGKSLHINPKLYSSVEAYIDFNHQQRVQRAQAFAASHDMDAVYPLTSRDATINLTAYEVYQSIRQGFVQYQNGQVKAYFSKVDQREFPATTAEAAMQGQIANWVPPSPAKPRVRVDLRSLRALDVDQGTKETPFAFGNEDFTTGLWLLKKLPPPGAGIRKGYIGVSGLQNLNYMAERGSDYGVIVDMNTQTIDLWKLTEAAMKAPGVKTPEQFEKEFRRRLPASGVKLYQDELSKFTSLRETPYSWLGDPAKFAHVRKMFLEDRIAFFRANLTNPKTFQVLRKALDRQGIAVDLVYLSNVWEWMQNQEQMKAYTDSVRALSSESTFLVDAHNIAIPRVQLALRDERVLDRIRTAGPCPAVPKLARD